MKVFHVGLLSGVIGVFCAMPSFGSSLCDAVPGNLVANCGFETGDLTDWPVTAASSGSLVGVDGADINSGSFDAFFGAVDGINDYIDQSIVTNAGDLYNISFYVDASNEGVATPDEFVANWDGTNLLTIPGATGSGYESYSFAETASTTSTDLQFGGASVDGFYYLDDVSVTDVTPSPEPASIAFAAAGLFGTWLMKRRYSTKQV
jgi:hypothetical protein